MPERSILPAVWDVPQEFRNRVGDQAGRQRAMAADGHLLLILHHPPGPDEVQRRGRFFWRSPDGTWTSSDLGSGTNALVRHLNEYATLLEKHDDQERRAVTADEYFAVINAVGPLHRAARNMHQALQQARELLPADRELINFRDRAYSLERTAELLYGDARNSLEYAMARRAEDQAESSFRMAASAHRLNVLAAFFFPIATLSAIFGVNLKHGYEEWLTPLPFLGVLAVGLLLGSVLKGAVTGAPAPPPPPRRERHPSERPERP